MACPYFEPTERRIEVGTLVPLGDFWRGVCHAGSGTFEPDERLTSECCNMGYARGRCRQFPGGAGPDAVRFAIGRDADQRIAVQFAIEKDHHPYAQGTLEYLRATSSFAGAPADSLVERQARAYVMSYLRRKSPD